MTFLTLANAAKDADFQARCKVALWGPAQDILNESDQTQNHAARMDWAQKVFSGRLSIAPEQIATQVLRNSTIAALPNPTTASDGDIAFQVSVVLSDIIKIG